MSREKFERLLTHEILGFTVSGACPRDPASVKCCLSKSCTNTAGQPGTCLNNPGPATCSGSFVTGRCPSTPNDVQCCVGGAGPANDEVTVDFWINAFIPLSVPGITEAYPKDLTKSMIRGVPVIGDCFLTDQRSFSSAISAPARMHSQATVKVSSVTNSWSQVHFCGETVEVDCEDGDVESRKTQTNSGMAFNLILGSNNKVILDFKAARNNPLVTGSPDIDLVGTLTVDRVGKFVEFVGKVDDFPAFEAYVSINGGAPRAVATLGPKPGAGPTSLFGAANRPFTGRISF